MSIDASARPGEHTEHENDGWTIDIPDHPRRSDSPEYVASRRRMNELLMTQRNFIYGCGLVDDPAAKGSPNDRPS